MKIQLKSNVYDLIKWKIRRKELTERKSSGLVAKELQNQIDKKTKSNLYEFTSIC